MLKIRSPVITRVLFWYLQFSLQDELHTGLIKAGASVGCDNHVLYVKLMTLMKMSVLAELTRKRRQNFLKVRVGRGTCPCVP